MKISNTKIFYNKFKYNNKNIDSKNLYEFIHSEKTLFLVKNLEKKIGNFILVLGGDGTLLKAIQKSYKKNIPYLGINFGSKGFLLNSLEEVLKSISFKNIALPIFKVKILEKTKKTKKVIKSGIFFNELDIRASYSLLDLDVKIKEKKIKLNIKGDGLILSTPMGSTGYNSALGGPMLDYKSKLLILSPKASFLPRLLKPILIRNNFKINILNTGRISDFSAIIDGFVLIKNLKKEVDIRVKKAKTKITFILPASKTLDKKVFIEQGFSEDI